MGHQQGQGLTADRAMVAQAPDLGENVSYRVLCSGISTRQDHWDHKHVSVGWSLH